MLMDARRTTGCADSDREILRHVVMLGVSDRYRRRRSLGDLIDIRAENHLEKKMVTVTPYQDTLPNHRGRHLRLSAMREWPLSL